jgi:hypothetical protein
VDETFYVWLLGSCGFVRVLHSAFYRALDWGGCRSGAIGVVMNGMYGSVVAASRATLPRSGRCHGFDGKKKLSKAKVDAMDLQVAHDQIMKKEWKHHEPHFQ